MPRERSLLDRVRDPDAGEARRIHGNTARLAESVLDNLRRLLNSRHGHALTQDDYGIPDLTEVIHNYPESIAGMRRAIRRAIEKYEPRLERVQIQHAPNDDDPFALRFEIKARLVTEEGNASVWFETRIDTSGEVQVKG
ncbi:MAG: type VI secretion system baseplate subunit TssE [Candidatus Eisenbacteria bacterium]|uniref:Type VI secretion system baseplate subunit TssE n=1 Tax=Eiseniibacteriota bacterium TaxID=2212470 RepID=A0A948W7P8_UNCEI|nr:type VI secretion system baseplate subunit TssE [Candidatus Eisenbacteria bacterium]MBU1948374.1 type VI secretion system baseplate subunit TssE [Candidatus Eisenbacteria bacterium]MBU2692829.1 type VI secretion system baseplate subunit TssE [Candidatus Eisenbacteria bacterium]